MSWIPGTDEALVILTAALAGVTALLAVVTLWTALGTRKLAAIAEKDFRAARLPVALLSWADSGIWLRDGTTVDGRFFFALIVPGKISAASDQIMILQRLEIWGAPIPTARPRRFRRIYVEEPMCRLAGNDSHDFVFNYFLDEPDPADAQKPVRTVRVEVEVGSPTVDDSERWVSFSDIYQGQTRTGSYGIRSRGPLRRQRDQNYREKLKRTLERWDECQERWKREMGS